VGSTTASSSNPSYLAVGTNGEVYLACSIQQTALFGTQAYPSRGSTDAFLVKYDAPGTRQWVQQFGGPGDDELRRGTVDAAGNLYLPFNFSDQAVVGSTTLRSAGNKDLALLKLTNAGGLDWVRQAGGSDYDIAEGVSLDPFGNVYVAGLFMGTATAGAGSTFTSAGHYDALLLSYTSQGTLRWGTTSGGLNPDDFYHLGFDGAGVGRVIGRYSATLPLGKLTLSGPAILSKWFVAQFTDNVPTIATITTVAPSSGAPGQAITLSGSGFVGVTGVRFNGTSAASFTVQSATRLTAVVPLGVTAGLVSVTTAGGTASSPMGFTPTVLAVGTAHTSALKLSPNPATTQFRVAELPVGSVVQLLDLLGRVARETTLSTQREVSVRGLAPGIYLLRTTDRAGGQYTSRVVVE
jgi:hypothetical protein